MCPAGPVATVIENGDGIVLASIARTRLRRAAGYAKPRRIPDAPHKAAPVSRIPSEAPVARGNCARPPVPESGDGADDRSDSGNGTGSVWRVGKRWWLCVGLPAPLTSAHRRAGRGGD